MVQRPIWTSDGEGRVRRRRGSVCRPLDGVRRPAQGRAIHEVASIRAHRLGTGSTMAEGGGHHSMRRKNEDKVGS
jgi:hypothetical protein